jgi:hypothetical protein
MVGKTNADNFNTTSGAYQQWSIGSEDTFVLRLNPSGSALDFSTYIGGSNNDWGNSLDIDGSGNIYVTGTTWSVNFPVTLGAFQNTRMADFNAFVFKLNPTASDLVFSTYVGGSGINGELSYAIAVDAEGNSYVTGRTYSTSFNVTDGAIQSTYGGGGDVMFFKLNHSGSNLDYATYLGGSGGDLAYSIAVDSAGDAYLTGLTGSGYPGDLYWGGGATTRFPITSNAFQNTYEGYSFNQYINYHNAFVSKIHPAGDGISDLVYSTYVGGRGAAAGMGIAIDPSGTVCVAGYCAYGDFNITAGAYDTTGTEDGKNDAFVFKLLITTGTPPGRPPGSLRTHRPSTRLI